MNSICRQTNKKTRKAAFALTMLTLFILTAGAAVPLQAQTRSARAQAPLINHNTWSSGAAIPTPVWFPAGTGVIKGQIYLVGGYTATAVVANNQVYNPVTNTWSSGAPLPTTTAQGASAVVKNILYVFGGSTNGCSTVTNAVWAYNPKTNAWSSKAAMPTARCSTAATVANNIIYVIGGYSPSGGRLNTVESYNPATDAWKEEAPLLVGKSEPAVGLVGTTIVAADGCTGPSCDNGDNQGYNATTNSWTSLKSDPTARNAACAGAIGTQLYVAGGFSNGGPDLNLTESFKVSKNTWTTLAPIPQATLAPGSAVYKSKVGGVTDRVLYCFGGASNGVLFQNTVYNNVQIYQP